MILPVLGCYRRLRSVLEVFDSVVAKIRNQVVIGHYFAKPWLGLEIKISGEKT